MFVIKVYDYCGELLAESNNWPHALELVARFRARGFNCYARKG
jgi:hypothetical protein